MAGMGKVARQSGRTCNAGASLLANAGYQPLKMQGLDALFVSKLTPTGIEVCHRSTA